MLEILGRFGGHGQGYGHLDGWNTSHTLNDEKVRKAKLEKISILVGKVAMIDIEDRKLKSKKMQFLHSWLMQNGLCLGIFSQSRGL